MQNSWSFSIISTVLAYVAIGFISLVGLAGVYLALTGKIDLSASVALPLVGSLAFLALLPPVMFFFTWARKLSGVHAQASHFISRIDVHAPLEEGFFPKLARCLKEAEDRLDADSALIERRANELEQARASSFVEAMEKNTSAFADMCTDLQEKIAAAALTTESKSAEIENSLSRTEENLSKLPGMVEAQLSEFDSRTQDSLAEFGQVTSEKLEEFQASYDEHIGAFRTGFEEQLGEFKGGYQASLDGFQNSYVDGLQNFDQRSQEGFASFATHSQETLQNVQSKIVEDAQDMRATLEGNFRDLEAVAGKGVHDLQKSLADQGEKAEGDIRSAIAALENRAADLHDKLQGAMTDLIEQGQRDLENVTERVDAQAGKLEEAASTLGSSAGRIDEFTARTTDLDVTALSAAVESLASSSSSFEQLKEQASTVFTDFANLCANEKETLENLREKAGDSSDLFQQHIAESKDSVLSGRKRIEQFVEEARGAIFQERRRIDHAMEAALQQLDGRADSLTEMDKNTKAILGRLEVSTGELSDTVQSAVDGAVTETVSALKEGSDKAIGDFTTALETRGSELKEHLSSMMSDQSNATSEMVQESGNQLRDICNRAASLMDQQLENLEVQLIGLSGRVDSGVTAVAGKLGDLFEKAHAENVDRLEASGKLAEETRTNIEERIQDIRDAGVSAMNFANMLRVAEETVSSKTELMDKTGQQFARVIEDFEHRMPDLVSRAMEGIDGVARDLAENRPRLNGLIEQIDSDSRKIQDATERLAPLDMDKFRVDLSDVHDKLSSIARNMPQLGNEVAATVFARLGSQITNFVNGYEGRLGELDSMMQSLPASLERVVSGMSDHGDIKAEIAQLPDNLRAQLKGQLVELQQSETRSLNRLADEFQGLSAIVEQMSGQIKGQLSDLRDEHSGQHNAVQASLSNLQAQASTPAVVEAPAFDPDSVKDALSGQMSALKANQTEVAQQLLSQVDAKFAAIETGVKKALADFQPISAGDNRADSLSGFEEQVADIRKAVKAMELSQLTASQFDQTNQRRKADLQRIEGLLSAQESRLQSALADMTHNAGSTDGSLSPISEQALEDMKHELKAVSSLNQELEKLRNDVSVVSGQVVAQSEAVLSVPAAVDRLEGLENLYRTRDLLTGRKLGLRQGDIAFDQVSQLFDNIEHEAEHTVRRLLEEASSSDGAGRETLVRLLAHKENIDEWAGQLRNISTALALGQDAIDVAAQ